MKPSETIILDLIEERLKLNIKQSNGYPLAFSKVTRGKLGGFKTSEYPAVNFWPVRHSIQQTEYSEDRHFLHVLIDARILTRDDNFADLAAELIASIFTGVTRTTSAPAVSDEIDLLMESNVEEVILYDAGYQIGSGDSPWCGAAVELQIKYISPMGDLFTIIPQ